MTKTDAFERLDSARTLDQAHEVLKVILRDEVPMLSGDMDDAVKSAYRIAGLLASQNARNLPAGDPVDEILTIAGELEVNPEDAQDLRSELLDKIRALK